MIIVCKVSFRFSVQEDFLENNQSLAVGVLNSTAGYSFKSSALLHRLSVGSTN